MTQEEKEILIKDISARLSYGVKCRYQHIQYMENGKIIDINMFGRVNIDGHIKDICDVKPCLFPLSSMTEEQRKEYDSIIYHNVELHADRYYEVIDVDSFEELHDFYHKNHFDYRGLIPMGLAIDATNKKIY